MDLQRFCFEMISWLVFRQFKAFDFFSSSVLNIISAILYLFSPFDKKFAKLQGTLDFDDFIWILDDKPLVWFSDILIEFE